MEPLLENATISNVIQDAHTSIDASSLIEICCALAIPLFALLIGHYANKLISKHEHTSLGLKIIDFTAPLLSPLLAIAFSFAALFAFRHYDTVTHVMPFVAKLTIAWFAIRLIMLVSSRQSAGWFIICIITFYSKRF